MSKEETLGLAENLADCIRRIVAEEEYGTVGANILTTGAWERFTIHNPQRKNHINLKAFCEMTGADYEAVKPNFEEA